MPQIVNKTYFNKANRLNIPLAIDNPSISTVVSSPNNSNFLDNLCIEIEKNLLLNSLGLNLYNQLQVALTNLSDPSNLKWKNLVEGVEYGEKKWQGLNYELGFIAQKVYQNYISKTNEQLSPVGNIKVNSENSNLITPVYKIAIANQSFINNYQNGFLKYPKITENIIDWYCDDSTVEVSFYQYLLNNKSDFIGLNLSKFKTYEIDKIKNSFGI